MTSSDWKRFPVSGLMMVSGHLSLDVRLLVQNEIQQ